MTWPINSGKDFKGVYNLTDKNLLLFTANTKASEEISRRCVGRAARSRGEGARRCRPEEERETHTSAELSGGQQQRVMIARAIVTKTDASGRRRADPAISTPRAATRS